MMFHYSPPPAERPATGLPVVQVADHGANRALLGGSFMGGWHSGERQGCRAVCRAPQCVRRLAYDALGQPVP